MHVKRLKSIRISHYRHTVTLRRVSLVLICVWLISALTSIDKNSLFCELYKTVHCSLGYHLLLIMSVITSTLLA